MPPPQGHAHMAQTETEEKVLYISTPPCKEEDDDGSSSSKNSPLTAFFRRHVLPTAVKMCLLFFCEIGVEALLFRMVVAQ